MHVPALVDAELDLACLHLAHRALDVEGDRAGLRIRHQSTRTEHAAELADLPHLIGSGDEDVEVHPPFLDARNQLDADEVRARGLGLARLFADRDHRDAHRLTGAGGEHDRAAHDLIGVARIDAESHRDLDRLIELRERGALHDLERLSRLIRLERRALLRGVDVLLAVIGH